MCTWHGAGLLCPRQSQWHQLGCGLSAAPAVAWEELMPDALVFCDPCVAGPQAPGRTGTENTLAAPGTLPAELSLPCPVTQRPEGALGSGWSEPTSLGWGQPRFKSTQLVMATAAQMLGGAVAAVLYSEHLLTPPLPHLPLLCPRGGFPAILLWHRAGRAWLVDTRQVESCPEAGSKDSQGYWGHSAWGLSPKRESQLWRQHSAGASALSFPGSSPSPRCGPDVALAFGFPQPVTALGTPHLGS